MNVGSGDNDVTTDVTPYANIIPGFGTVAPKLNTEFSCRLGDRNQGVWSKAKGPSSKHDSKLVNLCQLTWKRISDFRPVAPCWEIQAQICPRTVENNVNVKMKTFSGAFNTMFMRDCHSPSRILFQGLWRLWPFKTRFLNSGWIGRI